MKSYVVEVNGFGDKVWYLNGLKHREDGPAVEHADGTKNWYINNKLHREDGPAVEHANGYKSWYVEGRLHREDGPAIERSNGNNAWYLNGQYYGNEEFCKEIARRKAKLHRAINMLPESDYELSLAEKLLVHNGHQSQARICLMHRFPDMSKKTANTVINGYTDWWINALNNCKFSVNDNEG